MSKYKVVYKKVFDDDLTNAFASERFANIPQERLIDADSIDEAKSKVLRLVGLSTNSMRTFKVNIIEVRVHNEKR